MGERGTQGTVANYPHSKTYPPAVPSLTAPATDGKLEGVSENEDICIIAGQYLPTTDFLSPTKAHVHGLSLERENWATPHMEST